MHLDCSESFKFVRPMLGYLYTKVKILEFPTSLPFFIIIFLPKELFDF